MTAARALSGRFGRVARRARAALERQGWVWSAAVWPGVRELSSCLGCDGRGARFALRAQSEECAENEREQDDDRDEVGAWFHEIRPFSTTCREMSAIARPGGVMP